MVAKYFNGILSIYTIKAMYDIGRCHKATLGCRILMAISLLKSNLKLPRTLKRPSIPQPLATGIKILRPVGLEKSRGK